MNRGNHEDYAICCAYGFQVRTVFLLLFYILYILKLRHFIIFTIVNMILLHNRFPKIFIIVCILLFFYFNPFIFYIIFFFFFFIFLNARLSVLSDKLCMKSLTLFDTINLHIDVYLIAVILFINVM